MKITGNDDTLAVFLESALVGTLYNDQPLAFEYAAAATRALTPEIPLQAGKINTSFVHAFFENLLPEGDQRTLISLRHHASSVFGMLAIIGGDTAGSTVLLPSGQLPQPASYQRSSWEAVNALLHGGDGAAGESGELAGGSESGPRLSISGAQFKLLVSIDPDDNPLLPLGNSPSTHILKPDMVRPDIKLFASALNETIVMRAAHLCGLPTAAVRYRREVKACLVERYDRYRDVAGVLRRHWQADFCQLSGKASDIKYEADGGPTFAQCFALLRTHSVLPAIDQRNLLRWLFFNLYVGNNDSHAKNLSILATPDGPRLAPFYDLMSTRIYAGLGKQFAFQIGGENLPGKIGAPQVQSLATSLGVTPKYLLTIAGDMASKVDAAVALAANEIGQDLSPAELVMAGRLQLKIAGIVKQMRARML
ncbi:putative HipA protein [Oxalobacteraceae bacterium IMCC9480]|nr:putative HipA protein [Oxalobacteraceae bacterium IMCC9480]NDP61016.1 type II toxin-antitoxin system HipA family toxin [Oxalobacteraceae bacterium]